jgi:hypothetical protein
VKNRDEGTLGSEMMKDRQEIDGGIYGSLASGLSPHLEAV